MLIPFLVEPFSVLIEAPVYVRDLAFNGLVSIGKDPLGCNLLLVNGLHLYLLLLELLAIF